MFVVVVMNIPVSLIDLAAADTDSTSGKHYPPTRLGNFYDATLSPTSFLKQWLVIFNHIIGPPPHVSVSPVEWFVSALSFRLSV